MRRTMVVLVAVMLCVMAEAQDLRHSISLVSPGNKAVKVNMSVRDGRMVADKNLPVEISYKTADSGEDKLITLEFQGKDPVTYFHYDAELETGYLTDDAEFYLPGFWYHKNMRSPAEAPSFKTSRNWNFREDRLSSPLTAVFDAKSGNGLSVLRLNEEEGSEALTTAMEGDVVLSGKSSLGYLGFNNDGNLVRLTFGYPYEETPRRYIRKLTLAPSVRAFAEIHLFCTFLVLSMGCSVRSGADARRLGLQDQRLGKCQCGKQSCGCVCL